MKDDETIESIGQFAIKTKIDELLRLITGRYSFILYADGTFTQINGFEFSLDRQEFFNDLMRESKTDLANEILRLRQLIEGIIHE